METNSGPIETVTLAEPPAAGRIRVRKVNWVKVLTILDATPGEWHLIGEFDQSVRTHIKQGRYGHIDPALYEATTAKIEGKPRRRANLYLKRKN